MDEEREITEESPERTTGTSDPSAGGGAAAEGTLIAEERKRALGRAL